MSARDGGCAFPDSGGGQYQPEPGMTLRDWFAGQALCGLVNGTLRSYPGAYAEAAYEIADAMIVRREV